MNLDILWYTKISFSHCAVCRPLTFSQSHGLMLSSYSRYYSARTNWVIGWLYLLRAGRATETCTQKNVLISYLYMGGRKVREAFMWEMGELLNYFSNKPQKPCGQRAQYWHALKYTVCLKKNFFIQIEHKNRNISLILYKYSNGNEWVTM